MWSHRIAFSLVEGTKGHFLPRQYDDSTVNITFANKMTNLTELYMLAAPLLQCIPSSRRRRTLTRRSSANAQPCSSFYNWVVILIWEIYPNCKRVTASALVPLITSAAGWRRCMSGEALRNRAFVHLGAIDLACAWALCLLCAYKLAGLVSSCLWQFCNISDGCHWSFSHSKLLMPERMSA